MNSGQVPSCVNPEQRAVSGGPALGRTVKVAIATLNDTGRVFTITAKMMKRSQPARGTKPEYRPRVRTAAEPGGPVNLAVGRLNQIADRLRTVSRAEDMERGQSPVSVELEYGSGA